MGKHSFAPPSRVDVRQGGATVGAGSLLEVLEPRLMVAGDVSVSIVEGNLLIQGDAASNHIVIDQAGLAEGQFRITGQDGTKISGQEELIISGVTRDVNVRLGDGMDVLEMTGVAVSRDLIIRGGHSGETFNLTGGTVGRNVVVKAGDGDNTTSIDGTAVNGRLDVSGGWGVDVLNLAGDANVAGRVGFRPGYGESTLSIENSTAGSLSLHGRGPTTLSLDNTEIAGATSARCGAGVANMIFTNSIFEGNVRIRTGASPDTIRITDSTFADDVLISTGRGDDFLVLNPGEILDGEGDVVPPPDRTVTTRFLDRTIITLGAGDDGMSISFLMGNYVVFNDVTLHGDSGSDSLMYDRDTGGIDSSYRFEDVTRI